MTEAIENLIKALNSIEEKDYETPRTVLSKELKNIHEDSFVTYENNFTAKLNERYAVLSEIKNISEPKDLLRQLQIPKKYIYSDKRDAKIDSGLSAINRELGEVSDEMNELHLIPDFIIHKGQDDFNEENQRLIAEVKTELNLSYKKFLWDFFKLNIYKEKFKFQNACFVAVNIPKTTIEKYLNKYFRSKHYLTENTENFYILVKENFKANVEIIKLWEEKYLSSNIN